MAVGFGEEDLMKEEEEERNRRGSALLFTAAMGLCSRSKFSTSRTVRSLTRAPSSPVPCELDQDATSGPVLVRLI